MTDLEALPIEIGQSRDLPFSVDSALLRELGERLVGQPFIALAELVKNAYDADASEVIVRLNDDEIVVIDNGHGMTSEEFQRFFLRIGTTHKQAERYSRYLQRPFTGSKGIGRLAVQFLAGALRVVTSARGSNGSTELHADVNWEDAVEAGDLTSALARVTVRETTMTFPQGSTHGTYIRLKHLRQTWDNQQIEELARDLWPLQPPFRGNEELPDTHPLRFQILFQSPSKAANKIFESRMGAVLDIWHARIIGKCYRAPGTDETRVEIDVLFAGEKSPRARHVYSKARAPLSEANFDIRIFHLKNKQREHIKLKDAQAYLLRYGGVHVYDGTFRLPYYGDQHQDWLGTERDHALRRAVSQLLPAELQVTGGLTVLPVSSRMFGMVHVSTAAERRWAESSLARKDQHECLTIQLSRDRLVENGAYHALKDIVRGALDFYSMQERKRMDEEAKRKAKTSGRSSPASTVEEVLEQFANEIPPTIIAELRDELNAASEKQEALQRQDRERYSGLLGALATAGIGALAFEHEMSKQLIILDDLIKKLRRLANSPELLEFVSQLDSWTVRARETRGLFMHLLDEENRTTRQRFKAQALIKQTVGQMRPLVRNIDVRIDIDPSFYLPEATLASWMALLQNVMTNAANAMWQSTRKILSFSSQSEQTWRRILIQDTGSGVDLSNAEQLFEPFFRAQELPADRKALGLGGTGLGLTIVRLICDGIGCNVEFVKPTGEYATALQLSWEER